ncbi:MAG: hypothetical protein AB1451_10840 [Nitrospirota bacterium]
MLSTVFRVMGSCIRRITSPLAARRRFRATAAVLLLAYFALAGEAIHCQYFPTAHNEHADHSTTPVPATDHAIHCLVANHAGSAAVNADGSAPLPTLTPNVRILSDEGPSLVSHLVRLTPVRAPPVS